MGGCRGRRGRRGWIAEYLLCGIWSDSFPAPAHSMQEPSILFWPEQQPPSPGTPPGHFCQTSLDEAQQGERGQGFEGRVLSCNRFLSKVLISFRLQEPPLNRVLSNSPHFIHLNDKKALASFKFLAHAHGWFKSQGHRRACKGKPPAPTPHRLPVGPLQALAGGSLHIPRKYNFKTLFRLTNVGHFRLAYWLAWI